MRESGCGQVTLKMTLPDSGAIDGHVHPFCACTIVDSFPCVLGSGQALLVHHYRSYFILLVEVKFACLQGVISSLLRTPRHKTRNVRLPKGHHGNNYVATLAHVHMCQKSVIRENKPPFVSNMRTFGLHDRTTPLPDDGNDDNNKDAPIPRGRSSAHNATGACD